MIVLIWFINLLLPIINILGLMGMFYVIGELEFDNGEWFWWVSLASFVPGFLFGLLAWNYDVPPRWFWVKSKLGLFENLVGSAFGYGISFALIPAAVIMIINIVNWL